jgi:hypothetical protein
MTVQGVGAVVAESSIQGKALQRSLPHIRLSALYQDVTSPSAVLVQCLAQSEASIARRGGYVGGR